MQQPFNKNQPQDTLTEKQVRDICRDEMRKNYLSGAPEVPPHLHDGVSNLTINEKYIDAGIRFNGTIDMTSNAIYTIPITGIPQNVDFYGGALGGGNHAIVIGNAKLGGTNLQWQPGTSTSVSVNNITAGIIQGSGALVIAGSTYICNSQGYICDVLDSTVTNNLATAKVISFDNTKIQVQVILVAPWTKITGLWIVT